MLAQRRSFASFRFHWKPSLDWGDGVIQTIAASNLAINQTANTFQGNHQYSMGGVFQVTVSVVDMRLILSW